MIQREYPHNKPEQVHDYLTEALTLVEELDPPGDLRPLVFAKAVDLLAAKQIMFEQSQLGMPGMAIPGKL